MELRYCFGKQDFCISIAPPHVSFLKKLCAGCLLLLASLYIFDTYWDSYQEESTAYLIAQGFVTEKLVAPASVKFPPRAEDAVVIKHLGRNRYQVSGYLHSRNTLGHEQRTGYRCIVRNVGGGEWAYEKILFE